MPYIGCHTNKKVSEEEAYRLERRLGRSIELFPGITEDVLMVSIQDRCHMAFKGNKEIPMVFVDVRILAAALEENPDYETASKDIMRAIQEEIGILEENIYITFDSVKNWGRSHDGVYML